MKKNSFLFLPCLLVLFAVSSCTQTDPNAFTLKGKIGDWNAPAMLYFSYWSNGEHTDSTGLQNGKFSFTGTLDGPAASRLILDYTGEGIAAAARAGHVFFLYLENGTVQLQSPDSLTNSTFNQSPINDEHQTYLQAIGGQIQDIANRMNAKIAQATPEQRADTAFMNEVNREFHRLRAERSAKQRQFAQDHPHSFFSVVAISEATPPQFMAEEVEPLFLSIDEKHRNTAEGRAFAQRIEAAKNIAVGKPAPNFTQNNPDGQPVSLSDFLGKYVLLDFWASWCGPCRQENPNLVKAYAEYKDKGFEILGVSLDNPNGREAWLGAIQKDALTWAQVSDLNGWNNTVARAYGVRAVPTNYLIDPQGVIIAKDLRGEALQEQLKKLFE